MRGRTSLIVLGTLVVGIAAGVYLRSTGLVGPAVQAAKALPAPIVPEGTNGLSPVERQSFYHLSEGGELFPLDWYLALEVEELNKAGVLEARPFIENIERYGYLSDPVSPGNPYGLPVGISFARSKLTGTEMIGLNCTVCHVGQITYGGHAVRLDGAGNMVLVNQMLVDMGNQMKATVGNPRRLARFWSRVREIRKARRAANDGDDPAGPDETLIRRIWHLFTDNRDLLEAQINIVRGLPTLQRALAMSTHEGYGRVDAFGIGRDELMGGIPGNTIPPDAPVSFPHIWGLAYTGWLQWGANTNSVMERNIGQALGVGALFDKNYSSTVRLDNLNKMEHMAYKLQPPVWPGFFPAIDTARAARGKERFTEYCAVCHEKWEQYGVMRNYQLHSLDEVGTDPLTAIAWERTVLLADGITTEPFSKASFDIISKVKAKAYVEAGLDATAIAKLEQRHIRLGPDWDPTFRATLRDSDKWPDSKGGKVYRSKTLVGIWATAPYLHNGSVPTMFDLLKFAKDRPKKFMTGQREYDPVHLGVQVDPAKYTMPHDLDPFELDTKIAGNWNTGHEWWFYKDLTDDMRYDIIEYLKTHNTEFPELPEATPEAIKAALKLSPIAAPIAPAAAVTTSGSWTPYGVLALLMLPGFVLFVRSVSANAARYSAIEPEDIQKIRDGVLTLQAKLAADQDRPLRRGTHAKGRCASGTFEVFDVHKTISDPTLAGRLAQGLFARPGVYRATVRFANGNPQIQKDKVGDVRACSFAVELPGGGRQDFALNNATTFPINDAHAFVALVQFANGRTPFQGFRSLRLADKMALLRVIFLSVIQSRPPKTGYQLTRYWSTVPFCHGDADAVKYTAIPCNGNSGRPLDGTSNELQNEIVRHVTDDEHMSGFDFGIQLLDTKKMRRWFRRRDTSYWIENGSIEWKERQAPFHVVGRLTLVRGSAFSEEACEAQYIDVTEHSTPASAPLGSLNRARWAAESASRKARLAP